MIKKLIFLNICFFFGVNVFAQFKDYPKLPGLFNSGKYLECSDYAIKLNSKEPRELYPVFYAAKSYLELYKSADEKAKLGHLKNSLKYAARIEKLDKEKEKKEEYAPFMVELHTVSLEYGAKIFDGEQKDKSKPVFESLAKIYHDTTMQYFYFYPPVNKTQQNIGVNTVNQKLNQLDDKGLKQGFWTKKYPNGQVAYEVYFKDSEPYGEYKRYHETGKLSVFINYDQNGEYGDAKIYNDKGALIAEGQYHKKLKNGHWLYYTENIKAAEDNYKDGKREGISRVYYKNGKVSDERNYTNDSENGVWRQYYPTGKIKLETRIDSGVRNSVYYVYYENGKFQTKGRYKNDQMDGEWIYYEKDGKEQKKIKFVMGKAENQATLDEEENKILMEFEKNKDRFNDPENYLSNPEDYLKASGLK